MIASQMCLTAQYYLAIRTNCHNMIYIHPVSFYQLPFTKLQEMDKGQLVAEKTEFNHKPPK